MTIARYALAAIAGLLAQFAILILWNPSIGEFSGGAFVCGQPFVWLALIALPTGLLGEQYLLDAPRMSRRWTWPLMGLIHFGATFLLCNASYALFALAVEDLSHWSDMLFAMLPFAALNTVSGLVFWAILSATRPK